MNITDDGEGHYLIECDAIEAKVLMNVAGCISGSRDGPRGVVDALFYQLEAYGITLDPNLWSNTGHYPSSVAMADVWPHNYGKGQPYPYVPVKCGMSVYRDDVSKKCILTKGHSGFCREEGSKWLT